MSLNVLTQGGGAGGETASIFAKGLSESDVVTFTSPKGRVKSGKWVNRARLPEEYQKVEYIQSSGTQYIDTEVSAKDITDSFIDFQYVSTNPTSNTSELELFAVYVDGNNRMQCGLASSTSFQTAGGATYSQTASTTARTTAKVVPIGSPNLTAYLFAQHEGNTAIRYSAAKIYSCQISTSAGMARNFVPCYIKATGEAGFYDLMTETFFGNDGTGEFAVGADVSYDGFLLEKVGEYGMWTVTATDGENTATQDVLVDAAIEFEIKLTFWDGYLYKDGDEYEEITGGWGTDGYSCASYPLYAGTKNETNMYIAGGLSNGEGMLGTINAVDLTGYTKLKAEVNIISTYQSYNTLALTVRSGKNWSDATYGSDSSNVLGNQTYEIDVSDVNEPVYITVHVGGVSSYKGYVYKIWLE